MPAVGGVVFDVSVTLALLEPQPFDTVYVYVPPLLASMAAVPLPPAVQLALDAVPVTVGVNVIEVREHVSSVEFGFLPMVTVGLLDADTETDAEAPHPPEYAITLYVPAAVLFVNEIFLFALSIVAPVGAPLLMV